MEIDKIIRCNEIISEIDKLENFKYSIDRNTKGTLGHTGKLKLTRKVQTFVLNTETNCKKFEMEIPYDMALMFGDFVIQRIQELKEDFENL